MQATQERVAVVRAIPMPGHKRRWCGLERWVPDPERRPQQELEAQPGGVSFMPKFDEQGKPIYVKHSLPWPDTEVKVLVVDKPQPFDPEANGGVPQEISPATFAMLKADPRISVHMLGGTEGDSEQAALAKAEAAKLEQELAGARRAISETVERLSAATDRIAEQDAQAQRQGEKIAQLEKELEAARLRSKR
jgi:hypothetical protein